MDFRADETPVIVPETRFVADVSRFSAPESHFFFGFPAHKATQNRMAGIEGPNNEKESGKDGAERGGMAAKLPTTNNKKTLSLPPSKTTPFQI